MQRRRRPPRRSPVVPPQGSDQYRKPPLFRRWRSFGQELLDAFLRIDALGLAKQVSYSVVFALVPSIFLVISIATLIERYTRVPVIEELRDVIDQYAPTEAQSILQNAVDAAIANPSTATVSVGGLASLIVALWAGMAGVSTLVEATNRAYGVRNTRAWPVRRLQAFEMTLAVVLLVIFAVLVAFFGDRAISGLLTWVGDPAALEQFDHVGQTAILIVAAFVVLLCLYYFGPSVDHTWRWSVPGALFTLLAWLAIFRLTGFVARRISYDTIYGAASGFILLLYVLYFGGVALVMGAVLNGVLGERYDRRRRRDLQAHPDKIRYVKTGQEIEPDPFKLPFKLPGQR